MPIRVFAAALILSLAGAAAARAQTYVSSGTEGELPANAEIVSSASPETLTDITGSLPLVNGTSGGNLFEIYINNPDAFSASTTSLAGGNNAFDTQLFLFNSAGLGLEANDDDPNTGQEQALLPAGSSFLSNQSAGDYYLLIEGSGRYPADSGANVIFPNLTDGATYADALVGPAGPGGANPFAALTGNSGEGGAYSIELTGAEFIAPVPEPSAIPLIALGCGVFWFQRRRAAP